MAKFGFAMQQNRDQFIVSGFQQRIGINVHDLDGGAEFSGQRRQRQLHVMTKVAIGTADQGQFNGHALVKFIIYRPPMITKRPVKGALLMPVRDSSVRTVLRLQRGLDDIFANIGTDLLDEGMGVAAQVGTPAHG